MRASNPKSDGGRSPRIAIIGGGITGQTLAIGLLRRNITSFTLYERASAFREIGAGIGFTDNAERAMKALDARIHAGFKSVAAQNSDDWFRYVDGFNHNPQNPGDMNEELMFKMYLGERGFEGCRRSDFLQKLVDMVPSEHVRFRKNLRTVEEQKDGDGVVVMTFEDGSTAEADVVIGCDGIKSRLRQLMFGPSTNAKYSHKFAFRGLIPMSKARAALGEERTAVRVMHLGQDAHALTFPVADGALLNVVAFATDPNPWQTDPEEEEGGTKFVAPATRAEAMRAFAAFGPAVKTIMSLLPEKLDKWAVFDTYDDPVPTYVRGNLCLAGDAAHASCPHHGAGAGCGIEDSLVLAELLAATAEIGEGSRMTEVLQVYNEVRYERSQWLVQSSRVVGEMYEWQDKECGRDAERIGKEVERRSHLIWDYDVDEMVKTALKLMEGRIKGR
ncbi:putative monooxygenase [Apodospora peruviana]|uniref:Monooxygenase n=1 Tax=Apodospora peruviana TaxID=516989 RepID=A0AAE0HZK2_9PEZI|nr:putative monooxygenase [Apodospora peruviana]